MIAPPNVTFLLVADGETGNALFCLRVTLNKMLIRYAQSTVR